MIRLREVMVFLDRVGTSTKLGGMGPLIATYRIDAVEGSLFCAVGGECVRSRCWCFSTLNAVPR